MRIQVRMFQKLSNPDREFLLKFGQDKSIIVSGRTGLEIPFGYNSFEYIYLGG